MDLMQRLGGDLNFKELEVLVMDEADRLLDMGFEVCTISLSLLLCLLFIPRIPLSSVSLRPFAAFSHKVTATFGRNYVRSQTHAHYT